MLRGISRTLHVRLVMRVGSVSIFILLLAGQIAKAVTFPQLLHQPAAALKREVAREVDPFREIAPDVYITY